jgi:hypothetical protein
LKGTALARLKLRRFGPWLLGLFVLAQVAGVVPLILDHAIHVFESQRIESHDHSTPGRHGDHRHGVADVKDECCSINHLTGVIIFISNVAPSSFAAAPVVSARARRLVDSTPLRLDRPPKTLSLI